LNFETVTSTLQYCTGILKIYVMLALHNSGNMLLIGLFAYC